MSLNVEKQKSKHLATEKTEIVHKYFCAFTSPLIQQLHKEVVTNAVTKGFLNKPPVLEKFPPHITLFVFSASEQEYNLLINEEISPSLFKNIDKVLHPQFYNCIVDINVNLNQFGQNRAGIVVDVNTGLRRFVTDQLSKYFDREICYKDGRFSPHITLGKMTPNCHILQMKTGSFVSEQTIIKNSEKNFPNNIIIVPTNIIIGRINQEKEIGEFVYF